jgi:hypothetical protein
MLQFLSVLDPPESVSLLKGGISPTPLVGYNHFTGVSGCIS